ncbi:hypothetical protein [Hellea balneolensis]|uniref:hypothetical protein n=1 Tax=Hellea balneolensis TaxID=287478 RepID=UPI0003FA6135|nr:hypothetical protein [Hellea balneolensis]
MTRLNRTASRLLEQTYSELREGYIQPTLLAIWESSGSGDAIAAEAMVGLELAAKDVAKTKRMTFSRLEETEPDLIKPMFQAAIAITESRPRNNAGAK